MRKILLSTIVLSVSLAGVVSAAGIWGTYKGNDIIRLTVGGDPVKVSDVPAISYNNRTMIPIYLLQQAGIKYTWDQQNKTVDITKQQPEVQTKTETKVVTKQVGVDYLLAFNNLSSYGITGISAQAGYYNGTVIDYVQVNYNGTVNSFSDSTLTKVITELAYANPAYLFILFSDNSYYTIKTKDARMWLDGTITGQEMSNRLDYTQTPQSYSNSSNPVADPATCEKIREDANRRGGSYSGGLEYQLEAAGCTP